MHVSLIFFLMDAKLNYSLLSTVIFFQSCFMYLLGVAFSIWQIYFAPTTSDYKDDIILCNCDTQLLIVPLTVLTLVKRIIQAEMSIECFPLFQWIFKIRGFFQILLRYLK